MKITKITKQKILKNILILGGFAWLTYGVFDYSFYKPFAHKDDTTPLQLGLIFEERTIVSDGGTKLHAWWIPAQFDKKKDLAPKGTVVHFHGNSGNIAGNLLFVYWLAAKGYNILMFDYRGFGASEGFPNRDGIARDGVAALDYVLQEHQKGLKKIYNTQNTEDNEKPLPIFVLAQSLGGAISLSALNLWEEIHHQKYPFNAIVIDSTFHDYRGVGEKIGEKFFSIFAKPLAYWWIRNNESPTENVSVLKNKPVFMMHSVDDKLIPYSEGLSLFDEIPSNQKQWHRQERINHVMGLFHPYYRQKVTEFLNANQ